ncbi:carbon-nitrogen family protein [Stylonychia lemnae]|uniref:Carbon-nitrogen family protein n=1 Tax=Stylonychia lemnae TaxID=5949 RepID=A0A078AYW4_STYLE|nr:carbon-nitrogen family protein [Stylonychia lemnae]|eukprot:CDW87326.1 carbon-nitrogen family protein [Stylonychia lemnae]
MNVITEKASFNVKIITLQYSAIYKNIEATMLLVDKMLEPYSESDNIDIVMLPELSFSGCLFYSSEESQKYGEIKGKGLIYQWCAKQAQRLKSLIIIGYIENEDKNCYNSMLIVDENGCIIKNYRKNQQFYSELKWALSGKCFEYVDAFLHRHQRSFRFGLGICQDIWFQYGNQYIDMRWAQFCEDNDVDSILFMTNWPDWEVFKSEEVITQTALTVWLNRMIPITASQKKDKNVYLVIASRTGVECGYGYVGSSAYFQLKPNISIEGHLEFDEQAVQECILKL